METQVVNSFIVSARRAVLLCFMPPANSREAVQGRILLTNIAQRLQQRLPDQLRVLHVDASQHPDVVKSFTLRQLPALVLVQQGVERWRQENVQMGEEGTLIPQLLEQINGLY